ncbi:YtxH domain-containing protein [Mumia zhuanghuii]|uniref:YtxH domain-containing protein n=2 Tax=Mumia TaxID=1546255 RepID=A0ABW1QRL2_9ACTN|nr:MULTISPECIES: YtxH domain-containing protein [Mumia]KAA1423862.1 YtxH domain-containing protein [Mumia zhuanghuii]
MSKLPLLIAAGVGYVLGARAGRGRYDQIVAQTKKLVGSQPVQSGVTKAGETIKDQAPVVKDKVAEAAHKVADKVTPGSDSSDDIVGTYSTTPSGNHVDVDESLPWTTSSDDSPRT